MANAIGHTSYFSSHFQPLSGEAMARSFSIRETNTGNSIQTAHRMSLARILAVSLIGTYQPILMEPSLGATSVHTFSKAMTITDLMTGFLKSTTVLLNIQDRLVCGGLAAVSPILLQIDFLLRLYHN